jgi:hypothetical protein
LLEKRQRLSRLSEKLKKALKLRKTVTVMKKRLEKREKGKRERKNLQKSRRIRSQVQCQVQKGRL